jgi:peptidoglycan/LPS O-acetylase OafA/YrhL
MMENDDVVWSGRSWRLPLWLWLIMAAGVVPVAMLGHHLVERPCRTALRRWADHGFRLGPVAKAA